MVDKKEKSITGDAVSGSIMVYYYADYIRLVNVHTEEAFALPLDAAYALHQNIEKNVVKTVTYSVEKDA